MMSRLKVARIWRAKATPHLVFMKNGSQPHESPFFLLSESEYRIEKSFFYQELWFFENSI